MGRLTVPDSVVDLAPVVPVVVLHDVEAAVPMARALVAGAHFLVSPGSPARLLDALADSGVPYLPGAATATEVMELLGRGLTEVAFFPAADAGGPSALRSLCGPLPGVRFCPTGGITRANAPSYLALPNVACVGGSWMTPPDVVAARDWRHVRALAREAATLAGAS